MRHNYGTSSVPYFILRGGDDGNIASLPDSQKRVLVREQLAGFLSYAETLFNINRRLADHWYHQATSWEEITDIHVDFVRKYNEQEHFAHRKRADGRRTPQDVLGWVKGREIDPAKLDDALTLRRVRQLDQRGYVRFQNWRIYAEAGLARRPADLWIYNETLSIQFTTTRLSQYAVHYQLASHRLASSRNLSSVSLSLSISSALPVAR